MADLFCIFIDTRMKYIKNIFLEWEIRHHLFYGMFQDKLMGIKETQSEKIMVRVSPSFKSRAEATAEKYGLGTSTLARMLLDRFCEATEQHGNRLVWPPEFNHYLNPQTYLDEIRNAEEERLRMVAEKPQDYGNPDSGID